MTFEIIPNKMPYSSSLCENRYINIYQNRTINECDRKNFLNSRRDGNLNLQ